MNQITFTFATQTELLDKLREFLGTDTATQTETKQPETETKQTKQDEAEVDKSAETKTRRTRRTKAEIEADKAKEEAAKEQAELDAAVEAANNLTYETDVKPKLVELASSKDGGRDAASAIVRSFGVTRGDEIPADKLADALAQVEAKLEEINSDVEL